MGSPAHQGEAVMLGFVIGGVCAVVAIKAVHRYRRHRFYARGGREVYGWRGHGRERRPRGGPMLGWIFEALQATPSQEQAIVSAIDELRSNRKLVGEELEITRADLARALRSGVVDDAAFEESFARQDRLLAQLRVSAVEAFRRVAESLDEHQRKLVADKLESRGWFGPRSRVWV
jgi:Spy/CpxP family protein refolding chaperone